MPEPASFWRWPITPALTPRSRQNLTGEQLRNRAITDMFEPGSTIKPITVGVALESGKAQPQTVIDTSPGRITLTGSTISDTKNYGALTVEGVIQKSSPTWAPPKFRLATAGTKKCGRPSRPWVFGKSRKLVFPVRPVAVCAPIKRGAPVEQATMSYGYGSSASLLQWRAPTPCSHNGGHVIPGHHVKAGQADQWRAGLSERTAEQVRKMLALAAGPWWHGRSAQTVGYSVGGKSGTARKQVGKSYAAGKYSALGLPAWHRSRIRVLIVAVMVDEPSNGTIARGFSIGAMPVNQARYFPAA